MRVGTDKREYVLAVLLGGLLFAVTYTIVYKQAQYDYTDYYLHMKLAEGFKTLIPYHITYPMWHFLVYAVYKAGWYLLGNMPIIFACTFVTSAVNVAVYLTIRKIITVYSCPKPSVVAFALCLVTPIYIPWYNANLYQGQWSPVSWHSPTNMIVKPFALAAFFLAALILIRIRDGEKVSRKQYIILAVTVLLSALAKPSFFQGFVPALGIYVLIALICSKFRKWKEYLFLCLAFVPGFLIILGQFFFTFYTGSGEGIGVGWFEAAAIYPNPLISTLLVLLFPLCYIILNFRKCINMVRIRLSLLFIFASWMECALLYENGARKYHANFSWALQLSYTVIWMLTTAFFFRDMKEADLDNRKVKAKTTALFIIWTLHLICGIYYVINLITVEWMWM